MENQLLGWGVAVVVLVGAVTDWRRRKIPNWLTLPGMAAGLTINGLFGPGFRSALWGMLAALGVYFIVFALNGRGAGDGKLMGAVGAFVGWPHIAVVMVLVGLLGGAAALVLAWSRGLLFLLLRNTLALLSDLICFRWSAARARGDYRTPGALKMPHGPVIAAGTLVFLLFGPK
jgi:prepilin peptidase CpaA